MSKLVIEQGRESFGSFVCPRCTRKLSWKKRGEWQGGAFGVLACTVHYFPAVWGIPIILDQPPVPFILSLVEQGRFQESLELALASALPPLSQKFYRRRAWARSILPNCAASFKMALSALPKSWRSFFERRLFDPTFRRQYVLTREMARDRKDPLLDLGAGVCFLAYRLGSFLEKAELISVDCNFYLLYFGRRFFPSASLYVCADARKTLPFRAKTFGGIICCGVSESISDLSKLFLDCHRLLQPSGFLCWYP